MKDNQPPGLTKETLEEACSAWQKRLRLLDWKITTRIARMRDMRQEDKGGEIIRLAEHRVAEITLLDPLDCPDDLILGEDWEVTLVHELLHIYTLPLDIPKEGPRHISEEVMLNGVAEALVMLARGEE